jgi:release factor glutamine methyltransferase
MKNSKALFHDFISRITIPESNDEIKSIAHLVFEKIMGLSRTDILAEKSVLVGTNAEAQLYAIVYRINQHEPIQYILEEVEFFGRYFKVNASVLIPRPETEFLVQEVIVYSKNKASLKILDVGTGSGCIPVTLVKELPNVEVYATDISDEALTVARENASRLQAAVTFIHHDILSEKIPYSSIDVVVSNPPYIAQAEEAMMNPNVLRYEPHLALFVPDDDSLRFYKAITTRASEILKPGGLLAMEINERFGQEVAALLKANRFESIEIVKDLDGKDRIVKGILI